MSGYPLLHPGLTPAQDWSDHGASFDSEEWVSTPPSWSDGLHHYWSDQGHVWTQMSGYPLLHPGLTPAQDWSDQGASFDSDEWVSTPPSWSDGLHHYWSDQGHVWTQMSGYPLLHPGLTPAQDWLDQGASFDSDEWVSTPPSWSNGLHHYWSDQGLVWTQMSGYPHLHPGPTPSQDWLDQGACLDSEEWVSTPPPWSNGLQHYWSDQGACLDSDEWVSTPPSWSDPCQGPVRPGGIFGLRRVGVHSSILVQWLAPLLVRPGACLDSEERVSSPPSWSDPCPGPVGPGGIFGLRRVGVHSSILV